MGITIVRQYYSYNIVNAHTFEISQDITMKITDKQPFMFLPVRDYAADLNIVDSEGKNMIILSDKEFEAMYGDKLTMSRVKEMFLEKLERSSSLRLKKFTKQYRVIAVLFNKNFDEYYEKVKVKWTESTKIKENGKISRSAEIPIFITRFGFKHNASAAIYLSVKTDLEHKIIGTPKMTNWKKSKMEFITILDSVRHKVYRFKETEFAQLISISVQMGLPNTVILWAKLGLISAILLPISVITIVLFTNRIPEFGFEIIAGVIALLIGERVLVFKDIPLMKRWSKVHYGLILWCMLVLVILMIVSGFIETSSVNTDIVQSVKTDQ